MTDPLPPATPQHEPAHHGPPPPAPPPADQWIPAALPVQALEYPLPSRGGRPGILTAIGVLSIIIAAVSGLYSLVVGFQGFGFYMISIAAAQATRAQAANAAVVASVQGGPAPSTQAAGATGAAAAGMGWAERDMAFRSLTGGKALDSRRRRHLDALLASAGRKLGTDTVSGRGTAPDSRAGERGPDYFVTRRGRLEVFDDRAVFFPTDGSQTLRVSAPAESASPVEANDPGADGTPAGGMPSTNPATGPGGLTQAEIQSVVQQVNARATGSGGGANAGKGATPQQVATIQSLLNLPGQQLVSPGTAQTAVSYGYVDVAGDLTIGFANGSMLDVGPQGNVVSQTTPAAFAAATTFSMNPWGIVAFIVTALVSLGLAVLLLVAGIVILRHSPMGRRLHLVYAWIKIPAAVAGGAASTYVLYELMGRLAAVGPGGGAMVRGAVLWGTVPAVLSCIYPIALLIALNTRSVREYYHAVAAGQ